MKSGKSTGSRDLGGSVPFADWGRDRFRVGWGSPSDAYGFLRSRQAVS